MKKLYAVIAALCFMALPAFASQTWFVRPLGGTRLSANVPAGQCDGLSDVDFATAQAGGTLPHCAFNALRYMWDDNFSGNNGQGTWVIAGGDTVVIRGCHALPSELNPSNPNCRIGWDDNSTGNPPNNWCKNVGPYNCTNPPIPAGTAGNHTKILGGCAFGTYTCTPINNNYPYGTTNETQIFGGMALQSVFNLTSTSYVDIEGIELTTHNGVCANQGSPAWPTSCSTNSPLSDFAQNGFLTNSSTTNVLLQDVYVHGLEASGLWGPIGAGIVLNRVNMSFNASDAWNLDDGNDTANGTGATLDMTYVTAIGNGCHEQYPILTANRAFPAMSCYDGVSSSKGGDTLSGQDGQLSRLTCDHCFMEYNTKDSWIGPHTQIGTHIITNSFSAANMGAQWKWGEAINGTLLFQNNLTVTNCLRMSETIPGAVQNFNQATGLNGSYLTNFCRAGGAAFANVERAGAVNVYYGNTVIANGNIVFQSSCGFYTPPNVFNGETNCGPGENILKDNNILGYTNPNPILGQPSALYFPLNADGSTSNNPSNTGVSYTGFYGNEIGLKGGTTDTCGTNNITCVNPAMVSQPTTPWPGSETAFDVFKTSAGSSFFPTSGSPLLGTGTNITGMTTDFFGATRPSPPARSGAELGGAPPTLVSIAVTPNPGAVNVSSTLAMTCTSTFSDSSTAACSSPVWTDTAAHSSINSSTGVVTGASAGSDTVTATIGAISGNATVNVSAASAIGVKISGGVTLNGVKFQ